VHFFLLLLLLLLLLVCVLVEFQIADFPVLACEWSLPACCFVCPLLPAYSFNLRCSI